MQDKVMLKKEYCIDLMQTTEVETCSALYSAYNKFPQINPYTRNFSITTLRHL